MQPYRFRSAQHRASWRAHAILYNCPLPPAFFPWAREQGFVETCATVPSIYGRVLRPGAALFNMRVAKRFTAPARPNSRPPHMRLSQTASIRGGLAQPMPAVAWSDANTLGDWPIFQATHLATTFVRLRIDVLFPTPAYDDLAVMFQLRWCGA